LRADTQLSPEHETSLYLDIGGSADAAAYEDTHLWNNGFNIGAGIGCNVSRIFSFIWDAHFNYFPYNPNYYQPPNGVKFTGGDVFDTLLMVNGKFKFIPEDNPVVPYALIGSGVDFYYGVPTVPYFWTTPGGSGAVFTVRLAIGTDFRLDPKTALFLQYNYVGMPLTGFGGLDYDAVSGISWVMANVGLKLTL
jgi:hypothetical protein